MSERDKIASRLKEIDDEKNSLDEYKKSIRQENLELIEKLDRLEYSNRELLSKVKSQGEFLAKKEVDYEELARENESNRKTLRACEFELEKIRETNDTSQRTHQKDFSAIKIENQDLHELMKTKERMLDDQLNQINQMRSHMGEKEEDVRELMDAKNKYRDYYEDKLGVEIDATERAKAKLDDANQRLQEVEDEVENLRQDNGALNDQLNVVSSQVKDKDGVLEFVEGEIQKIREKQEQDRIEMETKDEMLMDERRVNREMQDEIQTKNDEIRMLIERMETYRKHKDVEISKLTIANKQTKDEIKVMIREHDQQKRQAGEKLRLLNDMFKQ